MFSALWWVMNGRAVAPPGMGLQDRSFNLEVSAFVEEFAHRIDDFRPIDEYLLDLRVDDQVDVSLAVAQLGIAEGVVHLSVLLLDDRQRAERFAEQFELLAMDRELSGFGQEDKSFDPYDITYVEQLLEDLVVQGRFRIAVADVVTADVDLNPSRMVLQFEERCASHDSAAHDSAGDRDVLQILFLRIEFAAI